MKETSEIKKYKAIDFFCGGGGMTCGLRQAGIDVIAGVDLDENAKETYEFNNPGSVFVHRDVKRLHSNYFEKNFGVQKNDDRLIMVGCSPCQYYSIINTDILCQQNMTLTPLRKALRMPRLQSNCTSTCATSAWLASGRRTATANAERWVPWW